MIRKEEKSEHLPRTLSDQDLIHALIARNAEAAEILYERYALPLFRRGKRRGLSDEEAEDAIIIAFENVVRDARTYNPAIGPVRNWLFVVYRNAMNAIYGQRPPTEPLDGIGDSHVGLGLGMEADTDELRFWTVYEEIWLWLSDWDRYELDRGPGRGRGRNIWREVVERFKEALCDRFCGGQTAIATRCFWSLPLATR